MARHFCIAIPTLFRFYGGIQRFSNFLVEALKQEYPDARFTVFLFHDIDTPKDPSGRVRYYCFGRFSIPFRKIMMSLEFFLHAFLRRPDTYISTHLHFAPLIRVASKLFGGKAYGIGHGVEAWEIHNKPLAVAAARNIDVIVAVSKVTASRPAIGLDLPEQKMSLLYNTFESDQFQIGPRPGDLLDKLSLPKDAVVLLTVCRLNASERFKGYDRVLEAMTTLAKEFPALHYVVVGDGDDRKRATAHAAELGLASRVRFVGYVSQEELPRYYNLSDIFIMPSTGEGFGIVFLEALASGKPVIAGDMDGSREAVGEGDLGFLINPDDQSAICDAVRNVLKRDVKRSELLDPNFLRTEVVKRFGREQFQEHVRGLFTDGFVTE